MRLFLLLLFIQSMPMGSRPHSSGPPPTTVTFVNVCDGSNGGVTSGDCSWTGTPSAGNAVAFVVWTSASVTSVTAVSDGGSTYTAANGGAYANSTNFKSWVFYTCNYAGSGTGINFTFSGSTDFHAAGFYASGNTTTGTACNDGYAHNQNTTGSTAPTTSPNTITTTNANDLLIGFETNGCGSAATAGVDGQGHSYTLRQDTTGVSAVETLSATSTAAYVATATIASCQWNMEAIALK
jgi:hypothetical protein